MILNTSRKWTAKSKGIIKDINQRSATLETTYGTFAIKMTVSVDIRLPAIQSNVAEGQTR